MFTSALITFRETLEIIMVIGIVLTFLNKTNNTNYNKYIWRGVAFGIFLSVCLGYILNLLFGGFSGILEQIFEGTLMLITVGLITWMIMWIHGQKEVAGKIRQKIAEHIDKGYGLGIFTLVAVSVIREGIETVLYLKASSIIGFSNQLLGVAIGILAAIVVGYILFRYALKINLSLVFNITSVLLILFAAGLFAHGIHEFQEAGILPVFSFDPVINLSVILSDESIIGDLLKTFFGYSDKPTLLELISYSGYIVLILQLYKNTTKKLHN